MSQKREILVSPKGLAVYPHLDAPDFKFKEEGEFSTKLRMPAADAAKLVKRIEEEHKKAQEIAKQENPKKKIKESQYRPYEEDEETGEVIFSFKMGHKITRKKDGKVIELWPALFDAAGKPLPKGVKIGGGSTLRVAFTFNHYYTPLVGAGVGLRLEAVQVIDLKEWGERSADSFGFEVEEGFSADDLDEDSIRTPFDEEEDVDEDNDMDHEDDEEDADF